MTERHKSSQKWRKGNGGYYSPDGKWTAQRRSDGKWQLCALSSGGRTLTIGTYVTLADCQEIAEGRA